MPHCLINEIPIELTVGATLFEHVDRVDSALQQVATSCKRNGNCKECIIEVLGGHEALCAPTEKEEFLQHQTPDKPNSCFRLSCQAKLERDDVDVVLETFKTKRKILTESLVGDVPLEPLTQVRGETIYFDQREVGPFTGNVYGLCIDLGTTTCVMHLVDLLSGELLTTVTFETPQKYGGSDVMSRITYDGQERGRLHESLLSYLNKTIRELPVDRRQICELVVAGNATMRDLFFELDVHSIGQSPYKSIVQHEFEEGKRSTTSLLEKARNLRVQIHPEGAVYGLPLIYCHVGADTAGVVMALDFAHANDPIMMVDIGTNTEVVLGCKDKIMAASCPAGPAFEGGKITFGMPGIEGAIEHVQIDNGTVKFETIGEVPPHGICGSGLVDLLAELRRKEWMDELGRFHDDSEEFTVVDDRGIVFTRADMSELAQAKSANVAGQLIIMRRYGISIDQIETLYLAGGFANYINPDNAKRIGLIPQFPTERIRKVGNAALEGARQVLINRNKRSELEELVRKIEHVELEREADFFQIFVEGAQFKPFAME